VKLYYCVLSPLSSWRSGRPPRDKSIYQSSCYILLLLLLSLFELTVSYSAAIHELRCRRYVRTTGRPAGRLRNGQRKRDYVFLLLCRVRLRKSLPSPCVHVCFFSPLVVLSTKQRSSSRVRTYKNVCSTFFVCQEQSSYVIFFKIYLFITRRNIGHWGESLKILQVVDVIIKISAYGIYNI